MLADEGVCLGGALQNSRMTSSRVVPWISGERARSLKIISKYGSHVRKRTCEAMEGTAVIVQIAVGVVPIRRRGHWDCVAWRTRHDKRAFIDFLGVVARAEGRRP